MLDVQRVWWGNFSQWWNLKVPLWSAPPPQQRARLRDFAIRSALSHYPSAFASASAGCKRRFPAVSFLRLFTLGWTRRRQQREWTGKTTCTYWASDYLSSSLLVHGIHTPTVPSWFAYRWIDREPAWFFSFSLGSVYTTWACPSHRKTMERRPIRIYELPVVVAHVQPGRETQRTGWDGSVRPVSIGILSVGRGRALKLVSLHRCHRLIMRDGLHSTSWNRWSHYE